VNKPKKKARPQLSLLPPSR